MKTPEHPHDETEREDSQYEWLQQVTHALDQSCEEMDLSTVYALQRARQTALAQGTQASTQRIQQARHRWIVGTALASAFSLALVLLLGDQQNQSTHPTSVEQTILPADLELLSQQDFLISDDEDLEFYAWLESDTSFTG